MTREEFSKKLDYDSTYSTTRIWIWGLGHTTDLYLEGLKRLEDVEICGFCDNNPEKRGGSKKSDWVIISPEELYQQEGILVVISSWQKRVCCDVKKQLDEHGIMSMPIDEFVFKKYKHKVLECYDSFYNQESRDVYAHVITRRMCVEMPEDEFITESPYFSLRSFRRYGTTVFVDCGAYTGDTIEKFIWNMPSFKKIYGFEPDKKNFSALQKRCDRLKQEWNIADGKIELYNMAVGAENTMCDFTSTSSMGSVVSTDKQGTDVINMVTLDEVLHEKYTFLKADIESYEYNMLLGAERSIKMWKPNLAICIYHNAIDMITILPLIKKMVPDYKFAVRHHSVTFDETVLYAWLDENENGWVQ